MTSVVHSRTSKSENVKIALDNSLDLLGQEMKSSVYDCLSHRYHIELDDENVDPLAIENVLYDLFQSGSAVINAEFRHQLKKQKMK
jgi:bisphosphoglycerate-independent phosphoglycerate mutase (AlkP superfamily)